MMENDPQIKRDEQYPLLKVEAGGGDNIMRAQISPTITSSGWHVSCSPKQSWCSRWPEFVSACWMTAIIFAISFLVFFALGMSVSRRQPVLIVRCNDSKAASDVFYHHVISRDAHIPFSLFSEYLSYMAKQYPLLRFNVYFLIDDSWQNSVQASRHLKLIKRLVPQITGSFNTIFDQNYKREIRDFQRRYQNVNISVMYLSKYMAMTPLKFKWKMIPTNYLSFYARIYAIWQNGGIGFDLVAFNNQYNNIHAIDHRVDAILKQHNEGIKSEKYADTLNSFNNEEQNELFSMFFNFINQILNETSSFFSTDLTPDTKVIESNPVIRTHRSKRDIKTTTINNSDILENIHIKNETIDNNLKEVKNISEKISNSFHTNVSKDSNSTNIWNEHEILTHGNIDLFKMPNISHFNFDMPQVLFYYDISGFSDDIGPPYSLPNVFAPSQIASIKHPVAKYAAKHDQSKLKYLSLTPEGYFVAASSRHHSFLAQLFSAGCQGVNPKYAIKDTLLSQCSGFLRDDIYCDNIRVIYNVV